VIVDVFTPPFAAAVICTVVAVETARVSRAKVALTLPAGTVIVAGIENIAELPVTVVTVSKISLARGWAKFTIPVVLDPPVRELGVKVKDVGVFAVTVREAVLDTAFAAADT
jgi:hypothetical protein